MPRRADMNHVRRIVQLYELHNFSQNQLATMCNCSRTLVSNTINLIKCNHLIYKTVEELSDSQLEKMVYPSRSKTKVDLSTLDFDHLVKELKKPHVTKMTLWREYISKNPNGYQKTQFFDLLNNYMEPLKATMHIDRKPGEKMYVDWTGDPMYIYDRDNGQQIKVALFVTVIGLSSYPYIEGFLNQKKESFIQGHIHAFHYFNRLPLILVPDNDKSAVTKADFYDPVLNETYYKMAEHYNIGVLPARVRHPQDKGTVESSVFYAAENEIIGGLRNEKFFSLEELNKRILQKLKEFSDRPFQKREGSRISIFNEYDFPVMRELPEKDFEFIELFYPTVNVDYHIEVKRNFYSVPYTLLGKKVRVELGYNTVNVYYENKQIATHQRIISKLYQYSTDTLHMPANHQFYNNVSKEFFVNWAKEISPETEQIVVALFEKKNIQEQSYRSCMGIKRLYEDFGKDRFLKATKLIYTQNLSKNYHNLKTILENNFGKPEKEAVNHKNIRGEEYYK
jgi:transposase